MFAKAPLASLHKFMKAELKKLPKSQVEINFELDEKEFAEYWQKALEHLKGHVKMDGFRQGQVPLEMVEKKAGAENVLMEAGELAVKKTYSKFVAENKLEPIGDPDVQIVKIAKGNPFLFKVTVAVLPEIELPDYKEIAKGIKSNEVAVYDKEIQETLEYLQKSRAKFSQVDAPAANKNFVEIEYTNKDINEGKTVKDRFILGEGGFLKDFEDNVLGMKAGDQKEFSAKFPDNAINNLGGKMGDFKVKMISVQTMELQEINDDFAKALGVFESLVALKENLKEGITAEKQETEKQRKRGELLNKIAEKVKFELPEKMVQYEQERLFEDMKNGVISRFKMTLEQYLQNVKKTEQEVKDSFKLEAEKRIKDFLVLRQVGKAEKVEVSTAELQEEMNKAVKNYSKEQLEKIDMGQLREYSKGAKFNEKVFEKLESFSLGRSQTGEAK